MNKSDPGKSYLRKIGKVVLGVIIAISIFFIALYAFFDWLLGPKYTQEQSVVRFSERAEMLKGLADEECTPDVGELTEYTIGERTSIKIEGDIEFSDESISFLMINRGITEGYSAGVKTKEKKSAAETIPNEKAIERISLVVEALSGKEYTKEYIKGQVTEFLNTAKAEISKMGNCDDYLESRRFGRHPCNEMRFSITQTGKEEYSAVLFLDFQ